MCKCPPEGSRTLPNERNSEHTEPGFSLNRIWFFSTVVLELVHSMLLMIVTLLILLLPDKLNFRNKVPVLCVF